MNALQEQPIDPARTVADVVAAHPPAARVFAAHRIDFCCKGGVSIAAAAEARGLDAAALCAELAAAIDGGPAVDDPARLTTPALVARIVATHHALLRDALPWLETLAAKVGRVHGGHDPRLVEVDRVVHDLSRLLLDHLDDEEGALFPALLSPAAAPAERARLLGAMRDEHHEVAARLERLRALTDDLTPPGWACRSYRTLLSELARVEADIHVHVHLENHVLAGRFSLSPRSAP